MHPNGNCASRSHKFRPCARLTHCSAKNTGLISVASRSKVNAELRRLEQSGAARLGYRKIVVCDLELLRASAGADVMAL